MPKVLHLLYKKQKKKERNKRKRAFFIIFIVFHRRWCLVGEERFALLFQVIKTNHHYTLILQFPLQGSDQSLVFYPTQQLLVSDLAAEAAVVKDAGLPVPPQSLFHLFQLVPNSIAGPQAMLLQGQVTAQVLSFSLTLLLLNHLLLLTVAFLSSVPRFFSTRYLIFACFSSSFESLESVKLI